MRTKKFSVGIMTFALVVAGFSGAGLAQEKLTTPENYC
jgi:hypothetical protein